jgi:type II secretory ATPase GspE/PulE/Tfp pilus assembly ATPase PilB-like protein
MPQTIIPDMLCIFIAALPEQGGYFNPLGILLFLVMVILWAYSAAWVPADIKKIRVPLQFWIMPVFASGALCLIIWLLLPWLWLGFLIFALLYGPVIIAYVVSRNRRVAPAQTVLSAAHLTRLTKGSKTTVVETTDSKERTRISDHTGETPSWPKDPAEHAGYQALQDLLFDAIWRRASEVRLDLIPQQPVKVVYKVDGVDRAREPIESESGTSILGHLKRISGMNPEEHRRPQSGHFHASIGAGGEAEKSVEIEVKTSGSTAGQRALLRLIGEESRFRIPDLGFTKEQQLVFEKIVSRPKGIIVVSGPRAAGVTSTLYAVLRSHDPFMQNIHTLESPPSMDLENITQHKYDKGDGSVSFGKRFRSLLRTDPDVAVAGDTPDPETLTCSAAAARQGKKLYLGMTARNSFSALRNYLQGVGDNTLAAATLVAIINQRLVRILCSDCRRAYKPDPALLKKGNLPTGGNRPFYRPPTPNELEVDKHGNQLICPVCQGSGYLGRTAIFEMMVMDKELRVHLAKGTAPPAFKAEVRKKGMLYLQEVALQKVYDGITSINEVLRVTKDTSSRSA